MFIISIIRFFVFLFVCVSYSYCSFAQVTSKKLLPRNINVNYLNQIAPSVSGDGNHLIFLSDQVSSKRLNMMYSRRTGPTTWSDPEVIKEIDNSFEINHLRGYSISFDGKIVFFTTLKSGGIGGYDIWMIKRQGNSWSQPENPGKPINTSGHEADASLSPDGKTMYFMRCEMVRMNETENCTLFYATRKNSFLWNEPVALPANINTGYSATPRILSDNETIYFSAELTNGKGGYDLFMSRKEGSGWSAPKSLDFINSEVDDRYVGLTAKGDILFYSMKYKEKDKLVMAKIPEEYQPLKIYQVNGKVIGTNGQPIEAIVQVYDVESQKLATAVKVPQNTGEFYFLLKAGAKYDVSVNPTQKEFVFHSEMLDLSQLESSAFERKTLTLNKVEKGHFFTANNISFEPNSFELVPSSQIELRRLSLLLRNNPNINLEIGAHLDKYISDSIQSLPELTEVLIDTLPNPAYQVYQTDSLLISSKMDSLRENLPQNELIATTTTDIDSLSLLLTDSIITLEEELNSLAKPEPLILNYTYHNNRTEQEAETIFNALIGMGVPENRISYKGYSDMMPLTNVTDNEESKINKRIEIKLY